MKILSNFSYPSKKKYIIQGTIDRTDNFLDSNYDFDDEEKAAKFAKERQTMQGGKWRVVINKGKNEFEK